MSAVPVVVHRRPFDDRPRRDPVRPGHRVELEVDVLPAHTSIPGVAGRIKHGVQRVTVHHEDLPKVRAMVEDRMASWAMAEAMVARKRRKFVQEKVGQDVAIPEDEALWSEQMHALAERFTELTVAGAFREIEGRDRRALRSLEVIRDRVEPEVSHEAQLAADTARLLTGASQRGEQDAAMSLIREQAETIAKLEARLGSLEGESKKSSARKGS